MATKRVKKSNLENTANNIKTTIKDVHTEVLTTSDKLVDNAVSTGERWQNLMAKAVKGGIRLFGKQQEMALDAVEDLKGQYIAGNKRFLKLIGWENFEMPDREDLKKSIGKVEKSAKKAVKKATDYVKEEIEDVQESLEDMGEKASAFIQNKTKEAAKIATKTSTKAKVATKKAVPKASKPKTKKVTVSKVTTKKVVAKKATAKKTAKKVVTTNLKLITGVGPKLESLLKEAGYQNLTDIAQADTAALQALLDKAGKRYNIIDPTTWKTQAEDLLKG